MTEIGEISFNIIYLTFIWILVAKMYVYRANIHNDPKQIAKMLMIGFFLLALGDTGHVGFRVVAFALGGLETNALLVGLGALSTAITVGFLYMIILEVWRKQFDKPKNLIYWILLITGIIRLVIFIFPQNNWGNVVPPFGFSIARNIPLMIQGIGVAILILKDANKTNNRVFKQFAYCIFVSYLFYTPVIFFVQILPVIGMLMIPKTLAYMAMAWITYNSYFKTK